MPSKQVGSTPRVPSSPALPQTPPSSRLPPSRSAPLSGLAPRAAQPRRRLCLPRAQTAPGSSPPSSPVFRLPRARRSPSPLTLLDPPSSAWSQQLRPASPREAEASGRGGGGAAPAPFPAVPRMRWGRRSPRAGFGARPVPPTGQPRPPRPSLPSGCCPVRTERARVSLSLGNKPRLPHTLPQNQPDPLALQVLRSVPCPECVGSRRGTREPARSGLQPRTDPQCPLVNPEDPDEAVRPGLTACHRCQHLAWHLLRTAIGFPGSRCAVFL